MKKDELERLKSLTKPILNHQKIKELLKPRKVETVKTFRHLRNLQGLHFADGLMKYPSKLTGIFLVEIENNKIIAWKEYPFIRWCLTDLEAKLHQFQKDGHKVTRIKQYEFQVEIYDK